MKNYKHVIQIDEDNRKLIIHRILDNGTEEFFTETVLPDIKSDGDWDVFEDFAKQLGENILMDSPTARKLFRLC
jgi:hypothetical protein